MQSAFTPIVLLRYMFLAVELRKEQDPRTAGLIHYYRELIQDDYQPFDNPYVYYKYRNNAAESVERELEISAYRCGKEGVEFPVYEPLECGEEQLAYDADSHKYHCFACDKNFSNEGLSFCTECGKIMKNNEVDLCPECIATKRTKTDQKQRWRK